MLKNCELSWFDIVVLQMEFLGRWDLGFFLRQNPFEIHDNLLSFEFLNENSMTVSNLFLFTETFFY